MTLDPTAFREAIRTVSVSYPVPFLLAALLAFALACFGLSFAAWESVLSWVLVGIGGISALAGVGLAIFATIARPDLLRSERHSLISRWFALMGDNELDAEIRVQMGEAGQRLLGENVGKKQTPGEGGVVGDESTND